MQLTARSGLALAAFGLAVAVAGPDARADGTITLRGAYYKERSTRVSQPMVDADLEVGEAGRLRGHVLVDSITSASIAAGATGTAFNERRYETGVDFIQELGRLRLGGGGRLSTEPDYHSTFARLLGEVDLAQRNSTLGLALGAGHDEISNAGAQGGLAPAFSDELDTFLASLSVSQVLSPIAIGALTYDVTQLSGYQANPYRSVVAGGSLEAERVPRNRLRHAAHVSVRAFSPPTETTAIAGYRLYADDWGIVAHTPELRVVQDLAPELALHLRYRYHRQSAADFYQDIYDSADPSIEPYLTEDDKLSAFDTHTVGGKLDLRLGLLGVDEAWQDGRIEALVEYISQPTHYGDAIAVQLALVVPLEY